MKRTALLLLLFSFLAASVALAGEAGRAGAAFLKSGVGAKGLGLGEAYAARAQGIDALYWNPAGLAVMKKPELMITHNPLIEGSFSNQAAFAVRRRRLAMGLGYNGLSHSGIDGFDAVGNKTGDFDASDQVFSLGFGWLGRRVQFGLTGKWVRSDIDGKSADALAGDAGFRFAGFWGPRLQHAFVVKNIGGKLTFINQDDPLPMTYTFGNVLRIRNGIFVSIDASLIRETGFVGAGGVEWRPFVNNRSDFLALRGGYTSRRNEAEGLSGASFGLGFNFGAIDLDYAWVPFGDLGDTHAVTFLLRLSSWKRRALEAGTKSNRNIGRPAKAPFGGVKVKKKRQRVAVTLTNGRRVRGNILKDRKDSLILKTDTGKIKIMKKDILNLKIIKSRGKRRLGNIR